MNIKERKIFKKLLLVPLLLMLLATTLILTTQNTFAATKNKMSWTDETGALKSYESDGTITLNYNLDYGVVGGVEGAFISVDIIEAGANKGSYKTLIDGITGKGSTTLTFSKNILFTYLGQSFATKSFTINVNSNELTGSVTYDGKTINGLDMGSIDVMMTAPDNSKPIISGDIHNFVTNVDDPKPVEYFKAFLSATDDTDGDITDRIEIEVDNYTANKRVLGSHKVVFAVSDSAGNKATAETYVRVIDNTKPVINGSTAVVKIGYKETWGIETFRKTLTATDNYDTLTNEDIKVKTDGYTTNKTKLGTYNVVFNVKDQSDNEGIFTKPVQVYDNVKPTFSGPTVIASNNNTILTESDVRVQITAQDEIDGNLTSRIVLEEDNFTGNGNKVGKYSIKYSVTDNAGNKETHIVVIDRLDKIPPVIWIKDGVSIITDPTMPLTKDQIIDILIATNQVSSASETRFIVTYDEYTGNETQVGAYAYSIQAKSADGSESIHNLMITVADNEDGTTRPGTGAGDWFKDNVDYFIYGGIGIVAVAGLYFLFRKKRR